MLIYNLVVRSYGLLIWLASLRGHKAAQWVAGRRGWRKALKDAIAGFGTDKKVWVHCASYGEFEQGRPLIEAIRASYPRHRIILTFFSPSGYEAFKSWKGADHVCYLPLDTKQNAADFIELVQPQAVIFIKYEFWVNFLFQLKKRNIPTFLVSAVFKPHHPFFKWYGGLFRRSLATFTRLFIQDEDSGSLLRGIGITSFEISGDTRFDRVLKVKESLAPNSLLEQFKSGSMLIVAGSTWPGAEEIVLWAFSQLAGKNVRLLLAPHEVDQKSIAGVARRLESFGLSYSFYTKGFDPASRVMVLDTIGVLAKSYYYADCAYVGGGFNGGLHNVLEPAVFAIPVSFYGDKYVKYNEAVELLKLGVAANVNSREELRQSFEQHLFDTGLRQRTASELGAYFELNGNVTGKILRAIKL